MKLGLIVTEKKLTKAQIEKIKEIIPDAAFPKHLYSYHLKTESCDDYYAIDTEELDAIQFMKKHVDWEYDEWMSDPDMKECDIPYCDFHCDKIV